MLPYTVSLFSWVGDGHSSACHMTHLLYTEWPSTECSSLTPEWPLNAAMISLADYSAIVLAFNWTHEKGGIPSQVIIALPPHQPITPRWGANFIMPLKKLHIATFGSIVYKLFSQLYRGKH